MYRIDGGDQKGRNDSAKLGHITLDIYEHGHVAHYHRSYGAILAKGTATPVTLRPHVKTSNLTGIYVDMLHAWRRRWSSHRLALWTSSAASEHAMTTP